MKHKQHISKQYLISFWNSFKNKLRNDRSFSINFILSFYYQTSDFFLNVHFLFYHETYFIK